MDFQPIIAAVFAAYFLTLIGIALFRANRMRGDVGLRARRQADEQLHVSPERQLVHHQRLDDAGVAERWRSQRGPCTCGRRRASSWARGSPGRSSGNGLRRYTILEESLTLPDFFEKRFADRTGNAADRLRGADDLFHHVLRQLRVDRRSEAAGDDLRPGAQPGRGDHPCCRRLLHVHRRLYGRVPDGRISGDGHAGELHHPANDADLRHFRAVHGDRAVRQAS